MRAANRFAASLQDDGLLTDVAAVRVELFGSLGATGPGHGTPDAVVLGLEGFRPESMDPTAGAAPPHGDPRGGALLARRRPPRCVR
jgi:L-serine dehydratase